MSADLNRLKMRFSSALVLAIACSRQPVATASEQVRDAGANAFASDAGKPSAPADASQDTPDASDAGDAGEAPPLAPPPTVVLHIGDSMVGGYGGLTKALEAKFKPIGAKFVRDWTVAVSIGTFDRERHFADLLRQHKPDLVVLTLGANDVFAPYPKSLGSNITSIAHKASAGGRLCFWITPPSRKPDTGITEVIKEKAMGCHVFDSSKLKLSRAADGLHPTDRGGIEWVDNFWPFYLSNAQKNAAPSGLPLGDERAY